MLSVFYIGYHRLYLVVERVACARRSTSVLFCIEKMYKVWYNICVIIVSEELVHVHGYKS